MLGRQLDRHSGQPRDSDRRVQQGWGHSATSEDDARKEGLLEGNEAEVGERPEEETTSPVTPVESDDYLAEQIATKAKIALPAPRKANEGADNSKWKNTVAFTRDDSEDVYYAPSSSVVTTSDQTPIL